MIALTLCLFYISMNVKEMLMHMTGFAMDEDGSNQQLPYWDYLNANNFTLGAL